MQVILIQAPLIWENPKLNRDYFEEKISEILHEIDLIVLPEMFTTGFTMNPSAVAELMEGETVAWLKALAKAKKCAITGSIVIQENDNFYNRMLFVFPSGEIQHYDKSHLFTLAGEEKAYKSGNQKVTVDYLGWKICMLVCYDLRFPVFSRNVEDYDLLIYVASWPQIRINAWDSLLKARAIENMSYVIGVNRTGMDDNGHSYNGHSQIIDCLGNYVVEPEEEDSLLKGILNKSELIEMRNKFGFLNDKDNFELKFKN
ncbi:amidohydrolase [Flavobacterium weaverense]|uniref:Omega-amidase YafV n=1 Tax=Flavobacterium weaverense TaxID=271156 RepID=A0A3M0ADI9_9FLAO|nr:amidohydrolase [Flavobacterium weaverense]RMA77212.1 putative amidohydrolase [Flavobacterium weaverense]